MSNSSYLCGTDLNAIYPSAIEQGYDSDRQTIASDDECIPLLWLALYRETDLRSGTFEIDGEQMPTIAPICRTEAAISQLNASLPYLNSIFANEGSLDDYVEMLASALQHSGFKYTTIELGEIADLYPEEHRFDDLIAMALRGFSEPDEISIECPDVVWQLPDLSSPIKGPDGTLPDLLDELGPADEVTYEYAPSDKSITIPGFSLVSHRDVLLQLCQLRPGLILPSVRMYLDDCDYSEDEEWNFGRVLGAGRDVTAFGRKVPWEK